MRVLFVLLSLLALLSWVNGANNFVGSNLYYAAGLYDSDQDTLFQGLADAGVKVLRVWLDGESDATSKGTNIKTYPDLEPYTIGEYNDTVLILLDSVMVKANEYGIKLLISMHSWNALVRPDVYGQWYGTGYFYEEQQAFDEFDNRIRHILNHNHTTLNKPWKELYNHIFAFEAENEAMIGNGQDYIQAHQYWQCDRAKTIKAELGENSGILVTTGGESWMAESIQPDWLTCPYLDVIAIHGYGTGDFDTGSIQGYVQQAKDNGKMLIYEEWGACYFNTANNDCPTGQPLSESQRNQNIETWGNQIAAAGVPWMYWEILPNPDPHYGSDYEIGINDVNWSAFVSVAKSSAQKTCAWDFTPYLLDYN